MATKTFAYEAVDLTGKRSKGTIDASSEAAAAQTLRQQGNTPLTISAAGTGMQRQLTIPGFGGRTTLKDLSVFARQFATMNSSGMSLLRSLGVLEDQAPKPHFKKVLSEIRLDIEGGLSLSSSMAKHDRVFPPLMIAMIRAGETGGFLDDALERIATNLEKDSALRGKIKSALTYPVIVLAFSGLMITAGADLHRADLREDVHPARRQAAAADPESSSTPATRCSGRARCSCHRDQHARFQAHAGQPRSALAFDRMKLRLPVFGSLFTKIAISRFSRNLGTLLGGRRAGDAGAGRGRRDHRQRGHRRGDEGPAGVGTRRPADVGAAGQAQGLPRMVTQMIEVGEESGQISQMLDKIADFYDREVDSAAESLTASIEPIMVLLMGVVGRRRWSSACTCRCSRSTRTSRAMNEHRFRQSPSGKRPPGPSP